MRLPHLNVRRASAAIALTGAAVLIPAVAFASAGTSPAAAAARCSNSALTEWLGVPGDGAAGSTFYQLEISNTSHSACTLRGFPGVSAVGVNGGRLGSPAGRLHGRPERTLTLRPGSTVHAVLQVTDVLNITPSSCQPRAATGLRVFAPGSFASQIIPFTFRGCSRSGPVYLHVSTTLAGTGIPGVGD